MMPKHRSTLKIHKRRGLTMVSDQCRNPAHIGHSVPPAQVNTLFLSLRRVFLIPCEVRNLRAIVRVQLTLWDALPCRSRVWRLTNAAFSRRSESNVFRWTCRARRVPPPLSRGECRWFYVPGSSTCCCCWFVKFFPFLRRWKSRAGNTSLYPRPFSFTLTDESILQAWSTCFGCTDRKWKASRLSPPFS